MGFYFRHPTTLLIAGPTQSGKTHFLLRTLKEQLFQPKPTRILYVYGEWQPLFEDFRLHFPKIEFQKELTKELYESLQPTQRNLVIIDDKMNDEGNSKTLSKMFTQGAHHRNLSVVFIIQNLFHQGESMRAVSLNSHYMIIFRNPRDKGQIRFLSSQMYPGHGLFLVSAYEDATKDQYGYLVVDLHPKTEDEFRVRTGIFNTDRHIVYMPREYKKGKANGDK